MDSRNAVFITDHGSSRDSLSRAFRVWARADTLAVVAVLASRAGVRVVVPWVAASFTAEAFSSTACLAEVTRSLMVSVELAGAAGVCPYVALAAGCFGWFWPGGR
jgi:hypothetical protein